jgi:hypothetical protein
MNTDWNKTVHEVAARRHARTVGEKDKEMKRLIGIIEEQEKQVEVALALADAQATLSKVPKIKSGPGGSAVAFAIASDWHVEETVDPRNVNGLNAYDLDIARDRVRQFFQKVVRLTEIQRAGTKIDTLVLALLGDLMTGYIHEELRETNGLSPTETVLWLQDEIASGLALLEKHYERLVIPCSFGNHGRCHDADTELLTWDGWKRYDEIEVDDTVATYNTETGECQWQPLKDVYVDNYDGEMFHVVNASVDFMVTPKHRMVMSSIEGKPTKFVDMEDLNGNMFGHWFMPKVAEGHDNEYEGVSDEELSLLGWIWTDGSISYNGGYNAYRIHQSKEEGCADIRELLDSLGYQYGVFTRDRKPPVIKSVQCKSARTEHAFSIFKAHNPRLTELLPDKNSLPEWFKMLSKRQVGVFMEAVKKGNGSRGRNPNGHYEISGRKHSLDALQALLIANGVSSRVRIDKRGDYVLSVRMTKRTFLQRGTWDEVVSKVHYSGIIWCGTVENGTLITRRNGIPLISGNSTVKPRHATGAKNSYEWMLYHILAKNFPQYEWRIADGYHNYLEVDGRVIRFHHGDDLKYQGGVGGLTIPVEKAIAQWNRAIRADLDVFGHWHQSQQNPKWISNSSLIGHNAYAIAIKAGFEPPSQTFFLMDAKRGRTVTAPIYLD